jgi:hypothetical protein
MDLGGRAWLAAALAFSCLATGANAVEKCKVKVDKKTGLIEFSASNVDGATLRWGDTTTNQPYAFYDPACVKGDKAAKCTLADPGSSEAKTPPRACTLYAIDSRAGCIAWIPGCTPGLREVEVFGGQIGAAQILDGSIGSAELAAGAVGRQQIGNAAVGTAEIANGSIGGEDLAPGSIGADAIAEDGVGAEQIGDGAVGSSEIAANAVGAVHIANDAVGTIEIAAGAVGMAEVDLPIGNAGNGTPDLTLDSGDNYHFGNATTFTPSANGKCLVITTATIYTEDGQNADLAFLQTAREENLTQSRDLLDAPIFPRIPDKSTGSLTVSAVWDVTANRATRFGCYVFVDDTSFVGDGLRCRTTYSCQ